MLKLAMCFIMIDNEDYFRSLVKSFVYDESYEKRLIDSATLGFFGNELNMIALSLLFLRPIKCYSPGNIAFNVNTSKIEASGVHRGGVHPITKHVKVDLSNYKIKHKQTHKYASRR